MVLKGVTEELLRDAGGSSYSHKLPSGDWMFGGASNIGGRCLNDFFGKEENIQKTIKLWEAIAARYNGNEWVAGYDLLNEPGGALGTEQFEVYDRIYKAVRAIDQDHIIQIQAIWEPTHLQLQHYMAGKMLFINIISMDGMILII